VIARAGLLALAAGLVQTGPAAAWQKFEEYRILGTDLRSVSSMDPAFAEDPMVLELVVGGPHEAPVTLHIETDGDAEV